jgi:hypothetical protein
MDKQTALEQFEDAAYRSGGLYRERIMASAKLAITIDPDSWPAVLASLRKWRPEFFSEKEAIRRQTKSQAAAKRHTSHPRQFASHRQPPVSCGQEEC